MFRLSHLLIVALATIGIFMAPTPAEAFPFPHVTAVVTGLVDTDARPGESCQITGWTDPVLHQPNAQFPNRTGSHVGFGDILIQGTFHLTTASFIGQVRALTTVLACSTNVVAQNPLVSYGLILPASFSSPAAGLLVLDPGAGGSCVYGNISGGLFLTAGIVAVALITINFRITHPGIAVGDPCPPTTDHNGPHRVRAIAVLAVAPCGVLAEEIPGFLCPVIGNADVVVGVVTLLPVSAILGG